MHLLRHGDGDPTLHVAVYVRVWFFYCRQGVCLAASRLPLTPTRVGHPQKPQKDRNVAVVGGTPTYTSASFNFHRSGDVSTEIAPGMRWRQCPRLIFCEHCPSSYARGLG